MLALTPIVLQLIQAGVALAPEIIQAAITEVNLLTSGTAPTAAEKAAIDAALDAANTALQNGQPGT